MTRFKDLPFRIKAMISGFLTLAMIMMFTFGVGAASVQKSIVNGSDLTPVSIRISPTSDIVYSTIRIDIIRNSKVLCYSEGKPTQNSDGSFSSEYTIDSSKAANCPTLLAGDVVRATLIQSSRVSISSAN